MTVTLIWLSDLPSSPLPSWPLGTVTAVYPDAAAIDRWLVNNPDLGEYCLFWDARLGNPPLTLVQWLCQRPDDVWHSGLCLGMAGLPRLIDFVDPVWPFNRDPEAHLEATSWRLSLQACLVRTAVLQQLGGPDPRFTTLTGASLELGHRWLRQGAFMRYTPALAPTAAVRLPPPTLQDEFLFVRLRYGRLWHAWAFFRALVTSYLPLALWRACWQTHQHLTKQKIPPFRIAETEESHSLPVTIAVLIPTLNRYPHLFQLLRQLRRQTIPLHQIIVVDQTPTERRQLDWPSQFTDLPLSVIWRDEPGQCTSRNAGLHAVQSDYILFLDDDDEIPAELIATHLAFLAQYPADASCGVAAEVDAGTLAYDFTYPRVSDVFPTNNTLLKKTALHKSGLFDLAYEHGSRADGDLGIRLYLAGKKLLLNPAAQVIHLHAPHGGLRHHKARVTTRANSQTTLTRRHLLAPTEGYLWSRYFTSHQLQEALLIRTLSSLRGRGNRWQQWARLLVMVPLLPYTYYQNSQRLKQGQKMLQRHPTIPTLMNQHCPECKS